MVNVSLPQVMKKQLEAIVKSGHFSSKSDVLKEGFRLMLQNNPNLMNSIAVQLGKDNLPIGQIADITGLKNEEVKKILKDRGIKIDE